MVEASWRSEPRQRARSAGVLAMVLLAFAGAVPAAAHVVRMSTPELATASPHIVVARVESRESRWNARHTLLFTDYTLSVEERLRGDPPERLTISVPGGSLGRLSDETCVTIHLEPGSRYLLFLGRLDQPSLIPVTGAGQGMFREIPGALAAKGESLEPLVLQGRPVRFADLVAAIRPLAAKAYVAPPPTLPYAGLPVKTWDPNAPPVPLTGSVPPLTVEDARNSLPRPEKFVYHELSQLPVVVNPLPADSPFSPWDQHEMAFWNLYGGDGLFRVTATPSATWSYGNGVDDIGGFPDDAQLQANFNVGWGDIGGGVLAFTMARRVDGVIQEADVVFNPKWTWTLDDAEGTSRNGGYPFKDVALHELGHVWGLLHAWEYGPVGFDSIMNYKSKFYYAVELFADDTAAVRAAFPPGAPLRDGLISSYTTYYDEVEQFPEYTPARPSVSKIRAGGSFSLIDPIKIENPGTVPLARPMVEVYLAPTRLSFTGAVLAKRLRLAGTVTSGATQKVDVGKIVVPKSTKPGTYYLAFFLRDPKDVYQGNNGAWSTEDVTLTVTRH